MLCSTLSAGCWCDAGYYICGADGYSGAANCCAPCPAGQFIGASCGLTANWGCNNCPAGSFSAATASASCSPCALDTISGTGATTCTPCAAGTYTFGSGATECNACPPGTFSFNGALPCSPCPPGTYSKASGARNCVLCPAGTFGDHAGLSTENCSGTCATCTAGSTSVPAAPVTCSAGSVPSGAVCAFCPPGTFAPANAPQCLLCPAGHLRQQCRPKDLRVLGDLRILRGRQHFGISHPADLLCERRACRSRLARIADIARGQSEQRATR